MDLSFARTGGAGAFPVAAEIFPAADTPVLQPAPAPAGAGRVRKAPRNAVDLEAGARRAGGSGVAVRVTDLSTHGFCMETHLLLEPGADVWLRLPSLEMRHAKVVWARGAAFGCAFEAPLSPLVLDLILDRVRAAGR